MVTIHWFTATLLYILILSVTVTESSCLDCLFQSKRSKDHPDIKVPVRRIAFHAPAKTSNKKKSKERRPEASKLLSPREFASWTKSKGSSMHLSLRTNQPNSSTQSYVTQGTQTDELSNPSKNSNPSAHTSVLASLHLLGTNVTFDETSPEVASSSQRSRQKRVFGVKRGKTFGEPTNENLQMHTTTPAITASYSTTNQFPHRFFVYGTLRDDDDSNAWWTKSFVKDCIGQDALLYGFKLYKLSQANYPFALKTNSYDFVVGRLLYWNEDRDFFVKKLQKADGIEGYRKSLQAYSEHNLYQREVVDVVIASTQETEKAIVYYRTNAKKIMQNAIAIPYGDWLKRNHVAS